MKQMFHNDLWQAINKSMDEWTGGFEPAPKWRYHQQKPFFAGIHKKYRVKNV
jgi:hypothetical protein